MPRVSLRIEHADGSTSTLDGVDGQYTQSLTEQAHGEVRVYREDWTAVESSVDERNDKFYFLVDGTEEFGGRYDDSQRDGGTVSVRLNSPEIDAADAEPTANNHTYQNQSADTIATDAINAVSTLSTGTINTSATGLSYSVSHGSRSKVLYDLREMTGIEFRYNADFTVDILDRLGADKTLTLGPAEGNIGEDFSTTVDVREEVTHVRVLGGQSGPDQVTAEAVASSYSGGRPVWKRHPNKEIIDQSRAQQIADTLVTEYDGEPRSIEIECTVFGEDLRVGDRVTVDYPEEHINRKLKLVSLTTKITRRGYLLLCTLANQPLARETQGETKRNDDIDTHNRGYGGFVDRDQTTSGWNAAGDGTPQTLKIVNWPDDVVEEKTVELTVLGRAWRSPIDPLAHSHSVTIPDHFHTVDVTHPGHDHNVMHPSHDHDVTHPQHSHDVTVTHPSHDHGIPQLQVSSGENTDTDGGSTTIASTTSSTSSTPYFSDQWNTVESVTPSNDDIAGADLYFSLAAYPAALDADVDQFADMDLDIRASWDTEYFPDSGGIHVDHFHRGQDYNNDDTNEVWDYNTCTGSIYMPRNIDGNTDDVDLEVYSTTYNAELVSFVNLTEYSEHSHPIGGKTIASDTSDVALGTTATESSDAKLGTTETSTTALGTTETSTTSLGSTSTETTTNGGGTTETTTDDVGAGAEVIDTFSGNQYYPTDVEIAVNGYSVTTISGDSTQDWQETIDLAGQLGAGTNTITATPAGERGEINLILASELFRRGKTT
jgi:hypothetical protein